MVIFLSASKQMPETGRIGLYHASERVKRNTNEKSTRSISIQLFLIRYVAHVYYSTGC